MKYEKYALFVIGLAGLLLISAAEIPAQAKLPRPELVFVESKNVVMGLGERTVYRLDVVNKSEYPAEMFDAAPDLPACGRNPNSSRTWIHIFVKDGGRIYGFCAMKSPDELSQLSFNVPKGANIEQVYIVMHDRKLNRKFKSNLVRISAP